MDFEDFSFDSVDALFWNWVNDLIDESMDYLNLDEMYQHEGEEF